MATTAPQARIVMERCPTSRPRGSWPADEYAAAQHAQGTLDARVVMDLATDPFLVITETTK